MKVKKQGAQLLIFCTCILLLVSFVPAHSYAAADPTVSESYNQQTPASQQSKPGDGANVDEKSVAGSSTFSVLGNLLQVVFALGVVILLIYLVFRFLSKKQLGGLRQSGPMKNVGGVSLGNNKSLQVVQVGDSLYVLGVGENVQLLRHIPAGDEMDVLLSDIEIKPSSELSIGGWLDFLRREKQQKIVQDTQSTDSFEQLLEHQWDQVNQSNRKQSYPANAEVKNKGEQS